MQLTNLSMLEVNRILHDKHRRRLPTSMMRLDNKIRYGEAMNLYTIETTLTPFTRTSECQMWALLVIFRLLTHELTQSRLFWFHRVHPSKTTYLFGRML